MTTATTLVRTLSLPLALAATAAACSPADPFRPDASTADRPATSDAPPSRPDSSLPSDAPPGRDAAPLDALADATPPPPDGPPAPDVPPPSDSGCRSGTSMPCYTGPAATRGRGACHDGVYVCRSDGTFSTTCAGQVLPAAEEVCGNTTDEDCDGVLDNGCGPAGPPRSCADPAPPGCTVVDVAMPSATFTLGEDGALFAIPLQPEITLDHALGVDAYEVTVGRFRRFWEAGHPMVGHPVRYPGANITLSMPPTEPTATDSGMNASCNWSPTPGAREAHPINCVDWYTAMAFCVWDGGRLPTQAEWEYVARYRPVAGTTTPRRYAWGDTDPMAAMGGACDRAQFGGCMGDDGSATRRVGSFAGADGIFDLTGNVTEWNADVYSSYGGPCWPGTPRTNPICTVMGTAEPNRSTRGGGAADMLFLMRAASHNFGWVSAGTGFRCVRAR